MALGNEIVLAPEPRGVYNEGTINGSDLKPGQLVMVDTSAGLDGNGRATYIVYNSGGSLDLLPLVLVPMFEWGKDKEQVYLDGEPCRVYTPVLGEQLNLRVAAVSGTADTISFGDILVPDDGTGNIEVGTAGTQFQAWEDLDPEPALENDLLFVTFFRAH